MGIWWQCLGILVYCLFGSKAYSASLPSITSSGSECNDFSKSASYDNGFSGGKEEADGRVGTPRVLSSISGWGSTIAGGLG